MMMGIMMLFSQRDVKKEERAESSSKEECISLLEKKRV